MMMQPAAALRQANWRVCHPGMEGSLWNLDSENHPENERQKPGKNHPEMKRKSHHRLQTSIFRVQNVSFRCVHVFFLEHWWNFHADFFPMGIFPLHPALSLGRPRSQKAGRRKFWPLKTGVFFFFGWRCREALRWHVLGKMGWDFVWLKVTFQRGWIIQNIPPQKLVSLCFPWFPGMIWTHFFFGGADCLQNLRGSLKMWAGTEWWENC